jgi:hypothetical protein
VKIIGSARRPNVMGSEAPALLTAARLNGQRAATKVVLCTDEDASRLTATGKKTASDESGEGMSSQIQALRFPLVFHLQNEICTVPGRLRSAQM